MVRKANPNELQARSIRGANASPTGRSRQEMIGQNPDKAAS